VRVALVEIWSQGGTTRYAYELARALSATRRESDEVHLIVPEAFPYLPPGVQVHRALQALRGTRVGGRVGRGASLVLRQTRQGAQSRRTVARTRPDILHLLGASVALRARTLRGEPHKLVVTVHDIPPRHGPLRERLLGSPSASIVDADALVVHGGWSRDVLTRRYGRGVGARIAVIPHPSYDYGDPTDAPAVLRERYRLPHDRPVILFFGSIRHNKGLDILLSALARNELDEVHLFVVGHRDARSEPPVERYEQLANAYGVRSKITWITQYVPDAEVPDIVACSDLVALPYREGFASASAVLQMAAAYAKPVVASDVGEIGPTVRGRQLGVCVEPGSPSELAVGIRSLLSDDWPLAPKRRDERAAEARSEWLTAADQHWRLYRGLRSPAKCG
jgi:glycosyltransferase involved in cell wall biosynthesis